jgi:hypothetical protein
LLQSFYRILSFLLLYELFGTIGGGVLLVIGAARNLKKIRRADQGISTVPGQCVPINILYIVA